MEKTTFESLLDYLGKGRYQIINTALAFFLCIILGLHVISSIFVTYPVPFRCKAPLEDNISQICNITLEEVRTLFTPVKEDGISMDQCKTYPLHSSDITHYCNLTANYPNSIKHIETVACDHHVFVPDGTVESSVISDFDITCDKSWLNYVLQSAFMFGVFLNGLIFGKLSDRFGRKPMLLVMLVATSITSFLISFVQSLPLYVILRFLVGCVCFLEPTEIVLVLESVIPRYRSITSQIIELGFSVGIVLVSVLAMFAKSWRTLQQIISLITVAGACICWLFDESPRWLLARGRNKEAIVIIKKIARVNRCNEEVVSKIERFEENLNPVETTQSDSLLPVDHRISDGVQKIKSSTMLHTLYYDNLRRQTIIISYLWFTACGIYYGLALNVSTVAGNVYLNTVCIGLLGFPACFLATYLSNVWGRCVTISLTFILSGMACIVMYFIGQHEELKTAQIVMFLFGFIVDSIAFSILYTYTCELYPTPMRSIAANYGSSVARVGATVCPFIVYLKVLHEAVPFITFGLMAIIAGILCLLLPETRAAGMLETMDEADKFNKENSKSIFSRFGCYRT